MAGFIVAALVLIVVAALIWFVAKALVAVGVMAVLCIISGVKDTYEAARVTKRGLMRG